MTWKCQELSEAKNQLQDIFYRPKTQDVEVDYYTMGQITQWQCRGESPLQDTQSWQLVLKEKVKKPVYSLKKMEWLDESTLNLSLRFYEAKKEEWPFALKKGEEELLLTGISPKLDSILEFHELEQESAEPTTQEGSLQPAGGQMQPYPSISGMALAYPLILWILIGLFFLFLSYFVFRKWRAKSELKKFRKELKENFIAMTPIQNFYKDMRSLYRHKSHEQGYLDKLKSAYKNYLSYRFELPVGEWSNKKVYRYIKREHKNLSPSILRETYSYLEELDKIKEKDNLNEDLKNFVYDLQNNVESLEKELK